MGGSFVFPLLGNPLVHYVQIGIGQQWADDSSLRGSKLVYGAFIHNPGLQHCLDNLQHPSVFDSDMV